MGGTDSPHQRGSTACILTVLVLLASLMFPAAATTSPTDADGDNVPDTLEADLCGDPVARDLVDLMGGDGGACLSTNDLNPPQRTTIYSLWSVVGVGNDADGDGHAATVTLQAERVRLDPVTGDVVRTSLGTPTLPLDGADGDDTFPGSPSLCVDLPLLTGLSTRSDGDGDGLPRYADLFDGKVCSDVRHPGLPALHMGWAQGSAVDADDSDPQAPGDGAPWTTVAALAAWPGPDLDRDGLPSYVTTESALVRFVTGSSVQAEVEDHTGVDGWDRDDARPLWASDHAPVDTDDDGIPDGAEPTLCMQESSTNVRDGICSTFGNYVPPCSWPQQARIEVTRPSGSGLGVAGQVVDGFVATLPNCDP